jgi:prefoldin subunit 5
MFESAHRGLQSQKDELETKNGELSKKLAKANTDVSTVRMRLENLQARPDLAI